MLKLVKACQEYKDTFLHNLNEYKNDIAKFGLDGMRQTIQTIEKDGFDVWLADAQRQDAEVNLPIGRVGSTRYWLLDDEEYVGSFTLRHDLNDYLLKFAGHVGYVIAPSKRGKGYAFAGLKLVLREANERGLKRVLITCDADNAPSIAVINKAKNLYGGEQLADSTVNERTYRRIWINTEL